MFDDDKRGTIIFIEFIQQANGAINVEQVVVRQFFALVFGEHGLQVSVEITLLVWVFSVAQGV